MIVKLNLTANEYVRHGEIITLPAENITLELSTPYAVDELFLTITPPSFDGVTNSEKIRVKDGVADVTRFFTHAGKLEILATMVVRGVAVKVWKIEPFIIKELSGECVAIPEIENINAELATVKKAIAEIVNKIS